ncbi:MAG: tRNA (adenosine(37)-N6)-dimethylallyltransferase MiaA [Anaerolineae bacterium]|nr:tRNA (adenosine(37)-N6)-dimethylallyltransferase MiaA [Anaerolineae bacterium]
MPSPNNVLVVLIGPTAVGKTETALRVAEELDAEIVSADSRLFYRGMDIGTAKPSAAELQRVPHHLIDVSNPDQPWSLTLYQQKAAEVIAGIHARGRLPLLVGGTGQYIKAVVEGWQPPAQVPDPRLRSVLERLADAIGGDELHRRLAVVDPQAAQVIDARNVRRTIRALEVVLHSGRRFSEQRTKAPSPYRVLQIGLTRPRDELYARVDARIDAMFEGGLLDEVRGLLEKGYSRKLNTLSAIGYRETAAVLAGEMSVEEAKTAMRRLTRRYVRQQGAWFREEDPTIHWFSVSEQTPEQVVGLIRAWLESLSSSDEEG